MVLVSGSEFSNPKLSLLARLAVKSRPRSGNVPVHYDTELDMTRVWRPDGPFAIDTRGLNLTTKKKEVEKGEDQKDRW